MKTRIENILTNKLTLIDSNGDKIGEIYSENQESLKAKLGEEIYDFVLNKPFIKVINPNITNDEITLDISKNKSYILEFTNPVNPSNTVLKLILNTESGMASRGEIILKYKNATFGYQYFDIVNAFYVNSLNGYSIGYTRDIISYLHDGEELYVNIGNTYEKYVF